ncbi:MAG: hypothetical protein A3K67_00415, partial [Euryarchaeota archaeon RBG_16_62_10]
MTNSATTLVWKKLVLQGKDIVTSDEIRRLAGDLGKDESRSLRYLQEHGHIRRILRGVFYVETPEERTRGSLGHSVLQLVQMALEAKGVRRWYFGLETALKLNGMTHEYFAVDFVITDSFRTTKVIEILGNKFQFLRRAKGHFESGIVRRSGLVFSDPEKTVLDLAYKRMIDGHERQHVSSALLEHADKIDRAKARRYLTSYPP